MLAVGAIHGSDIKQNEVAQNEVAAKLRTSKIKHLTSNILQLGLRS